MFKLPNQAIEDLKNIYKKEFNIDMIDDVAKAEARRLLPFFYSYIHWLQNYEKQKQKEQTGKMVQNNNKSPEREMSQLSLF